MKILFALKDFAGNLMRKVAQEIFLRNLFFFLDMRDLGFKPRSYA